MTITDLLRDRRAFSPDDGAGAGADADDAAAAAAAAAAAQAAAPKLATWAGDARFSDDSRLFLTTKGIGTIEDPIEAVAKLVGIGQAADKRFGKPIDAVLDKPAKDQPISEWRRANAEAFGLPAKPEDYVVEKPETLAEGVVWSTDLEARVRKLAFERGLPPEDVGAMVSMYADYVGGMGAEIDAEMVKAEEKLKGELTKLWGAETEANTTRARQAVTMLAEKAGLDADGIEATVGLLSSGKPGQTLALRLFAALGEMMAEDSAVGLRAGGAGAATTQSEAKALFDAFSKPGGEWARANAEGNTAEINRLRPEWQRLAKLATGARG